MTSPQRPSSPESCPPRDVVPAQSRIDAARPPAPRPAPEAESVTGEPVGSVADRLALSRARVVGLIVLLGAMATLGPISVDLYLPSLPQVASDLGTTPAAAQLTITGVLIGSAVGQLVVGPMSDRFGRRRPALVCLGFFVLISVACVLAPTIEALAAARILSGVGASAGGVIGMAVVRDLFTGPTAARLMSRLVLVIGVAPLFAPTIGGALAQVWGWRTVLASIGVAGLLLAVVVWRALPETRPVTVRPTTAGARGLLSTFAGFGVLLRDRRFLSFAVMPGLAMAVVMSYVAVSPFVLQVGYGLSHTEFAVLFAVNGIALVGGTQVNAALVGRLDSMVLLRAGLVLGVVFAVGLLVVALTGAGGLTGLVVALWLLLATGGLVMPNAATLALAPYGERAGSAAALVTALQSGVGGVVGVLTGALGGDAVAMAGVSLGAVALSTFLFALVSRRARREGAALGLRA
ncbi:multidrug effflux MFS transporter [Kineococcus gynurae]|uniref:Multidrug effflux MFS transporter n=1 Tax=Kineococcus gynurae TaxID=452979 RepID=A0ABV5LT42_9ACTN